ncbi:MAG TPA: uracil-DNA glycosylase family protein [Pyrinomonadaceae bacterium]|jgi:DNA polymerase
MNETTELKDLLRSLTEDVAESVRFLRELGVEGLEDASSVGVSASVEQTKTTTTTATAPTRSAPRAATPTPALVRHANAEGTARSPIPKVPSTSTVAATPRAGAVAPEASLNQTDMARKTTRKSTAASDTPPAMDTLFGEITPMDEASLPRRDETLEQIHADIGECIRCPLSQSRNRVVHSEGNREARLMFVGEAPGADEDAQGRPFVGRAGQLLNKIIEAIGLRREDVFIGNVNRCRPPQNRTPTIEEAKACKGFLLREIDVVRPDVIVVLGNTAMKNLLDTKEGITKLRGQFQDYRGIKVMPTFHPAFLLRDPSKKRETWEDMKMVRDYLNRTKT